MAAKHSSFPVVPGSPRFGPAPTPTGGIPTPSGGSWSSPNPKWWTSPNPQVVDHGRRPVTPPVDVAVAGSSLPSTSPFALSPAPMAPPGAYHRTDTRIYWMNGRPYLVHGLLGKGGFGDVFSVEMLLPVGLEVVFSENGDIQIDEKGFVSVTARKQNETFPCSPPSCSNFAVSLADQVRGKKECGENFQVVPGGGGQDHGQTPASSTSTQRLSGGTPDGAKSNPAKATSSGSSTDLRPAAGHVDLVYNSGVFLALKTQGARSAKELDVRVKEVENLRFLTGEQGVVQIIDHAVCYKFLKLNFIMELGVGSFNRV